MPGLGDFLGDWTFRREIAHDGGAVDRASGTARFVRAGAGLRLDEAGVLTLAAGPALRFERAYLWEEGAGGRIRTRFADGRDFHDFDPAAPRPVARHDCAPDTYDVAYDFGDWPQWSVHWRVTGPRKAYAMRTIFTRPSNDLRPGA